MLGNRSRVVSALLPEEFHQITGVVMQPSRSRLFFTRRGIVAVGFQLLLGSVNITSTGVIAWFVWRADKEVPRAEAALRAAGYTLDVTALAAADVPNAENAGAIDPLLGIATRDEDQTPEIKERLERLDTLKMRLKTPPDADADAAARKLLAGGRVDLKQLAALPPQKQMPELYPDKPIIWSEWLNWFQKLGWHMPSTELTDAGTAYRTLALQTDFLTGPLREAAGRKFARLTPSQRSRFAANIARSDVTLALPHTSRFVPALRVLAMQMDAALAAGLEKEAAALVPLIFLLRDIVCSDVSLMDMLVRQTIDWRFVNIVQRNLRAGTIPAPVLEAMQRHLALRPSLEGMERILQMEAAYSCYLMDQVIEQRVSLDAFGSIFGNPNEYRGQRSWFAEPLVRSFLALNRAARIRVFLEDMEAWKSGGPLGYYHTAKAREDLAAARQGWTSLLRPDRLIADGAVGSGYSALMPRFLHRDMLHRMAIIACALERHRLAAGNFPANLTAISKALLQEVPADLDGQPIRYLRHDDGWVLWSVGMDLKDDLRGVLPAPDKMDDHLRADWQWRHRKSESK